MPVAVVTLMAKTETRTTADKEKVGKHSKRDTRHTRHTRRTRDTRNKEAVLQLLLLLWDNICRNSKGCTEKGLEVSTTLGMHVSHNNRDPQGQHSSQIAKGQYKKLRTSTYS